MALTMILPVPSPSIKNLPKPNGDISDADKTSTNSAVIVPTTSGSCADKGVGTDIKYSPAAIKKVYNLNLYLFVVMAIKNYDVYKKRFPQMEKRSNTLGTETSNSCNQGYWKVTG